jgi:hypothetical protein
MTVSSYWASEVYGVNGGGFARKSLSVSVCMLKLFQSDVTYFPLPMPASPDFVQSPLCCHSGYQ